MQRLADFQKTFQANNDQDCFYMCEDLKNMLLGKNANFTFENKKFKTAPPVSQRQNIMGLVNANSRMREEQANF